MKLTVIEHKHWIVDYVMELKECIPDLNEYGADQMSYYAGSLPQQIAQKGQVSPPLFYAQYLLVFIVNALCQYVMCTNILEEVCIVIIWFYIK